MSSRRRPMHPLLWLTPLALVLRALMFLGRGDYVAFDEGWYLLLGRNLIGGEDFTLSGLQHIALSPLFPILAGVVDLVTNNLVLSGRIVATITAALLVIPCWSIFHRLGGRRLALPGCLFVIAMPALAPFVVPYWIGWDLWVGAEPVLHLFLFTAIALVLRADEQRSLATWALAGAAFGLAYLARPEAILALGMIGLVTGIRAVRTRSARTLLCAALLGAGFGVTSAPYWLYLHDVTGHWMLTGRGVQLRMPRVGSPTNAPPPAEAGPSSTIERMLWLDDETPYVQRLYALDTLEAQLASSYWGLRPSDAAPSRVAPLPPRTDTAAVVAPTPPPPQPVTQEPVVRPPGRIALYARALAGVLPLYLWPLILIGAAPSIRRRRMELTIAGSLLFMSVAVSFVIAADLRTQLFLVPLAAFYCARGARRAGIWIDRRVPRGALRRRIAGGFIVACAIALLIGTQARWLYLSLAVGSPHHIVGAENARIGAALRDVVPTGEPLMSWHPAIALYADRDWRVLPHAPFPHVVRYAANSGVRHIVVSPYYPGPTLTGAQTEEHIVVQVPDTIGTTMQWLLQLERRDAGYLFGRLQPMAQQEPRP